MDKIKFWLMPNGGFESKQTIDRELALFKKQNPKIEIEYEMLSWSRSWFRLMQAIKEKTGPDIIQIGTTWIGTLGYLGAVRKLDKIAGRKNNFVPTFLGMCRFYDHLWALPWFCEGRVLFYRKDLLKKAGINPQDILNWDAFKLACAKISKIVGPSSNTSPLGFSAQKEQVILQDLASWIWSNGGDFLSQGSKHATLTQAETRQGMKFFAQLISEQYISKDSLEQNTGEVAENFFMHDAFAFMFSSSWPLQVYLNSASKHFIGRQKASEYGVLPIPAGPVGRFNFIGGSALAITSFSRQPDKAMKLLKFLTTRESITRYCKSINMLPSRVDVPISLNADKATLKIFQNAINISGRSFPMHPLWGSIEQIILNGIAYSLRDFIQSNYNQNGFFHNLAEINQEIEYMLSVFGE